MFGSKDSTKKIILFFVALICYASISTAAYQDNRSAESRRDMGLGVYCAESPGWNTISNNIAVLDISNTSQGYIGIKYTGSNKQVKVSVDNNGSRNIYDLWASDYNEFIFLPLHEGNGVYDITVLEHMSGISYHTAFSETIDAMMADETLPFLYPSYYVDFSEDSAAAHEAARIAKSAKSDLELVTEIYNVLSINITYDYDLESRAKAGIPHKTDIDTVLKKRCGICIDYATLMAAMLRSQGVPAKVVIGRVAIGSRDLFPSHTWVSACIRDGDEIKWIDVDPTQAATAGRQASMKAPLVDYIPSYYY